MNRVMNCIQSSYDHALVLTVCQFAMWPTYIHFFLLGSFGYQNTFFCFWCLILTKKKAITFDMYMFV